MRDDSGPAFPTLNSDSFRCDRSEGMSLRAYFAGQALVGLQQKWGFLPNDAISTDPASEAAKIALRAADAMITQLELR